MLKPVEWQESAAFDLFHLSSRGHNLKSVKLWWIVDKVGEFYIGLSSTTACSCHRDSLWELTNELVSFLFLLLFSNWIVCIFFPSSLQQSRWYRWLDCALRASLHFHWDDLISSYPLSLSLSLSHYHSLICVVAQVKWSTMNSLWLSSRKTLQFDCWGMNGPNPFFFPTNKVILCLSRPTALISAIRKCAPNINYPQLQPWTQFFSRFVFLHVLFSMKTLILSRSRDSILLDQPFAFCLAAFYSQIQKWRSGVRFARKLDRWELVLYNFGTGEHSWTNRQ